LDVHAAVDYGGVADFSLFFSDFLADSLDGFAYNDGWDDAFLVLLQLF
jgi:hypothetical protein